MLLDDEASFGGDPVLPIFDLRVEELFNFPTLNANQVVVVAAFIELENRLAGFEVVTFEQAGLLELGQYPINGRQTDVHVFGDEQPIHVFSGEMAGFDFLEQVEDLEPRKGRLQADTFEILGVVGHGAPENRRRRPGARRAPYDIVSAPR